MLYSSWRSGIGKSPQAPAALAPVTIVGGGFAGTMVAAQLARLKITSFLVEEHSDKEGAGAAYSTTEPSHLLNAHAEAMSAWPDAPDNFAAEWRDYGRSEDAYAPRFVYRRYLQDILNRAIATGHVHVVRGSATGARKHGDTWSIQVSDGTALESQHLVLATGNEAPRRPRWSEQVERNFIADPWSSQARQAIAGAAARNRDVLIIGSGLTMIDVALSLQSGGHKGRIVALSRNGLVPHGHVAGLVRPIPAKFPDKGLRTLMRDLRVSAAQGDWRNAVDVLRPHAQQIWQRLNFSEKQRFLRHARPWWEVHRHRVAPAIAARIDDMRETGHLEVIAGRAVNAQPENGRAQVRIRLRGTEDHDEALFDVIFNCAGPLDTLLETRNPLLDHLLRDWEIEPDELGIGLAVDNTSRVKGHLNLWATGLLTKGTFWEITAVPELREQAAGIAQSIACELGRSTSSGLADAPPLANQAERLAPSENLPPVN